MTKPQRIQLRRSKGYRKPEGAVYVGRPSKWGNPFDWTIHGHHGAVQLFAHHLRAAIEFPDSGRHIDHFRRMAESIGELRGKNLACWCAPGQGCHADVLLELANR